MAAIVEVTKRELNQQTARVLQCAEGDQTVIVRGRGGRAWQITPYVESSGLQLLEKTGQYTPPAASPAPWPTNPGGPVYRSADVDGLLDQLRGGH